MCELHDGGLSERDSGQLTQNEKTDRKRKDRSIFKERLKETIAKLRERVDGSDEKKT